MLLAALGLLLAALPVNDSVLADLNSPIYATREKARDVLRTSFAPTDSKKWDGLLTMLAHSKGQPADAVAVALKEHYGVEIPTLDRTPYASYTSTSPLDADWAIQCRFFDGELADARLLLEPPAINGDPPAGYTGLWRIYRENGALLSQIYYSKGKALGPLYDSPLFPAPLPPAPIDLAPRDDASQ